MTAPGTGPVPEWRVKGDWFDVCKCGISRPSEFAWPPNYGDCQGVLAYHIREGHYGDVRLDDLNLITIGEFQGNVSTGEAAGLKFGFFIDERADERQRAAMLTIFSGRGGGWPAQFLVITGPPDVLDIETAPIVVDVADDLSFWRAEVPGKVVAGAEALGGPTAPPGQRVQTINPPGSDFGPSGAANRGSAPADRVDALGLKFAWDGRSSKHIPFDWSGPGPACSGGHGR